MSDTAPATVDIWLVEQCEISDDALFSRYLELLDDAEKKRYQRLMFSRHREQFLVARALVRVVLAQYLGEEKPARLEFTGNNHGKPTLLPGTTCQFNLSHTHGLIVLAVTQHHAVGIDVEDLGRKADILNLARRYFSPSEADALHALPLAQRQARFIDLWTLKEAYLKACGTGLRTPLDAFSFTITDDTLSIVFSDVLDDIPSAWRFWQLDWDATWRVSLALCSGSGLASQVRVHKGIPLQGFEAIEVPILRTSVR